MITQSELRVRSSVVDSFTADPPVELSIVMPCLNESETIGTCIEKAQCSLRKLGAIG